jgi:hypothetical protein
VIDSIESCRDIKAHHDDDGTTIDVAQQIIQYFVQG